MSEFKPMLASPTDGSKLTFPMLVSPKLDGVRCLIIDGVAMSRSLKPIPNKHVQKLFGRKELNGLDGELIVGPPTAKDVYNKTTSGVMSVEGEPAVKFYVFDDFSAKDKVKQNLFGQEGHFEHRLLSAIRRITLEDNCKEVKHYKANNEADAGHYEAHFLTQGYEGMMLRLPSGPYKYGRSTAKEAWLVKLKKFDDSEAEIIGMTELMTNTNEAIRNELGHLERSSKKAGKKGKGVLGSLIVRDIKSKVEFEIGTGFTAAQREGIWKLNPIGALVKYKSQPSGVKDKPRFPVFLGFRNTIDL